MSASVTSDVAEFVRQLGHVRHDLVPEEHDRKLLGSPRRSHHAFQGEALLDDAGRLAFVGAGHDSVHLETCLPSGRNARIDDLLDVCILIDVRCRTLDGTVLALPETKERASKELLPPEALCQLSRCCGCRSVPCPYQGFLHADIDVGYL